MKFVPCTEEYWEFVRTLRTDARVAHRFSQVEITTEQQRKYMTAHWREYFIALANSAPAGYAGCVDGGIRICTHPDFQRRGVASFMMEHMIVKFPNAFATIKLDNEASRKLFEACGFIPTYTVYERPHEQDASHFVDSKFVEVRSDYLP